MPFRISNPDFKVTPLFCVGMSRKRYKRVLTHSVCLLLSTSYLLTCLLTRQVRECSRKDSDWWEAVNQATGEVGQIPRNYVTPDNDDKESQTYVYVRLSLLAGYNYKQRSNAAV